MAILAAVIGAIVVIGAVGAALLLRGGVAGTASPGSQTSRAATSAPVTSGSAASSPVSSPASPSASTGPGPVPGLPHSDPLPDEVLVAPRVVDGEANLYLMNASTGAVGQRLTDAPGLKNPVLSSDRGSMIYLQVAQGSPRELRTAAVDGSGDRLLFKTMPDGCDSFERPGWNPVDQTEIAVPCTDSDGNVKLHRLTIDGTDKGVIPTEQPVVDDVTYGPDGSIVAYWGGEKGGQARVYTQPADGSEPPTAVTDPPEGASDVDPVFSPDGSTITFSRSQKDSEGKSTSQLFSVRLAGSELTQMTDEPSGGNQGPIYSPDGASIAFKSNRPSPAGTKDSQIWVIDADGGNPRELGIGDPGFVQAGSPAWGHR
jgi:Tol biopolymer transport system component